MVLTVGFSVGGTIVACGYGDGDAEGSGGLAGCVDGVEGLRGPVGFGGAPAERDDAGLVGGVVDGGGDGVDETLVGVGSEVDDDVGAGSDSGGYFDVEHNFAVGAVGVGGGVFCAVNEDGGDLRGCYAEGFEIGFDVGAAVASAELEDGDGLILCSGACGKAVELGDLNWCVGGVGGGVGFGDSFAPGFAGCGVAFLAFDAEVGMRLGPIVEAKDGFDVADEFGREIDAAFADMVGGAVDGLVHEGGAEGLLHVGDGAGELDGAAFGARGVGFDFETELTGELADEGYGFGVCTVVLAILRVGETNFSETVGSEERRFTADDNGDDDSFAVWGWFFVGCFDWFFLAAGKDGSADGGRNDFFWRHERFSDLRMRCGRRSVRLTSATAVAARRNSMPVRVWREVECGGLQRSLAVTETEVASPTFAIRALGWGARLCAVDWRCFFGACWRDSDGTD